MISSGSSSESIVATTLTDLELGPKGGGGNLHSLLVEESSSVESLPSSAPTGLSAATPDEWRGNRRGRLGFSRRRLGRAGNPTPTDSIYSSNDRGTLISLNCRRLLRAGLEELVLAWLLSPLPKVADGLIFQLLFVLLSRLAELRLFAMVCI